MFTRKRHETPAGDNERSREAASFLGVPIHLLTMEQTLTRVADAMRDKRKILHVALNVAKFVKLQRDEELRADVFGADLVGIDGAGIVLGARLFGIRIPERVAGVDLMHNVLALCAEQGYRPYLLGARPEVLETALNKLKQTHPNIDIAGSHHGYFKTDQEADIIEEIRVAQPDCLFVGMPTPRKERFMAAHRAALEVPFVMGVGGGIDILAGHVRRAPDFWQRNGLEWLYRVLQEPRRMWWRYLSTNVLYAGILAKALLRTPGSSVRPPRVTWQEKQPGEIANT
jgi:N-acetylglucosaminyldiphosphoundecaprenol N-acetyl-beta-D-mannosaminyltransferase